MARGWCAGTQDGIRSPTPVVAGIEAQEDWEEHGEGVKKGEEAS